MKMIITYISENGGIKLLIKQITESYDIKELLVFMKKINDFGQGLHQIKVRYFTHIVYYQKPGVRSAPGFFINYFSLNLRQSNLF